MISFIGYRHRQFVYNVCYRTLGSTEDAADATQTAFIKAYHGLRKFRGGASFRSWLYRIAINECARIARREQPKRQLTLDAYASSTHETSGDQVWEAVLELTVEMRVVLVLFYFQDLSCREIAETLGLSEGAVRVRLHRARVAFREKYGEIRK